MAKNSLTDDQKASLETLNEQANMRPEPSQEDADRIKTGDYRVGEARKSTQPDGPAQKTADEIDAENEAAKRAAAPSGSATYQTRDAKG